MYTCICTYLCLNADAHGTHRKAWFKNFSNLSAMKDCRHKSVARQHFGE